MSYLFENTHFYDPTNWVVSFANQSKVLLLDLLFRIQGFKMHYFDTKGLGSQYEIKGVTDFTYPLFAQKIF